MIRFFILPTQRYSEIAFTSLALFNVLRFPLIFLPQTIQGLVEARISLNRMRDFLVCLFFYFYFLFFVVFFYVNLILLQFVYSCQKINQLKMKGK